MPVLNKDAILQATDAPRELVNVPEWGGEVYVKTLSAVEREDYEDAVYDPETRQYVAKYPWAQLLVRTLCDEQGEPVFEVSDVDALAAKSAPVLHRLYAVAKRLNRLDAEAEVKNSSDAPGGSSSSSSASPSASSTPTT